MLHIKMDGPGQRLKKNGRSKLRALEVVICFMLLCLQDTLWQRQLFDKKVAHSDYLSVLESQSSQSISFSESQNLSSLKMSQTLSVSEFFK